MPSYVLDVVAVDKTVGDELRWGLHVPAQSRARERVDVLVHGHPGDPTVVEDLLLDEIFAQGLLDEQVPAVLDYGVLDVILGLHQRRHFLLQRGVLGGPLVHDCVPLQQVGPAPELHGEHDHEDVLHLAARDSTSVREQLAPLFFDVVHVLH